MLFLYPMNQRDFSYNGEIIRQVYEAHVYRNSTFYLEFKVVIDNSNQYKKIKRDMLVKAETPDGAQMFRVWEITKHKDYIKVEALHVLYDLNNRMVGAINVENAPLSTALMQFSNYLRDTPFTFATAITKNRTFNTSKDEQGQLFNALDVFNDGKHSIVGTWECELSLNNYDVRLVERLGRRTHALLYERKNIREFELEESNRSLITRIHALSKFRPEREEGSSSIPDEVELKVTVDSPLINAYSVVHERKYINNDLKTEAELIAWAKRKFTYENVDKPSRTIKVKTNIIDGTSINYGDTLVLKYLTHDVEEEIRCVGYDYDPIAKTYYEVTLGSEVKTIGEVLTKQVAELKNEQLSNLALKQVEEVTRTIMAADGIHKITYGPDEPLNPREGDQWRYFTHDRPTEITYKQFIDGQWKIIVDAYTKNRIDEKFAEVNAQVEQSTKSLEAERKRLDGALTDLGVTKDLAQEGKNIAESALNNALQLSTKVLETGDKVQQLELDYDELSNEVKLKLTSAQLEDKLNEKGYATVVSVEQAEARSAESLKRELSKVTQRFPKKQLPLANTSYNNAVRYYFIVIHDILSEYVGKEAKVTFDLKVESNGFEREMLFYHYQYSGIGIKLGEEAQPQKQINVTKQWQTFSFNGEVIRKPIPNTYHQGALIIYDPTGDNVFSLRNIKIEVDDIVTSVEFNNVRETAQLYERIIGRTEADATTNISRMLRSSELFMSEITTGGRRNLYTGTKNFDGSDWGTKTSWQKDLHWYEWGSRYKDCKVMHTRYNHNGYWQNIWVKKGDKITISAEIFPALTGDFYITAQGLWDGSPFPAKAPFAQVDKNIHHHRIAGNRWTRVATTFTVLKDGYMQPTFQKDNSQTNPANAQYYITQIMVEKGENPTREWSESTDEPISNRIAQTQRLLELGLFGQEGVLDGILIGRDAIRIKSKFVHIEAGVTKIDNAAIENAHIRSVSASKLTAGTIDAGSINVINLNANNIVSGTLFSINLRGGILSALNGATKLNLNTGELQFFTDNAAMRRVVSGHPNQFIQFGFDDVYSNDGSQIVRTASTAIGSNRGTNNFTVDQSFAGIRIFNRSQNPYVDRIQYIGDLHEFTHSGNKNDFQNNIWAKSGGSTSDWAQLYPSFSGVKGNSSLGTWNQPWGVLFVEELYIVKRNSAGAIIARNKIY
ncbi:gp58-like family protein [Aerococcaceae bacterium NML201209]|nr:gp58-like family protein [Aerococcaceae bacterium NML201209]